MFSSPAYNKGEPEAEIGWEEKIMLNCFATLEALRERPLAPHMLELMEGMEALAAALQPPEPASDNGKVTAITQRPSSWSTSGQVQQAC